MSRVSQIGVGKQLLKLREATRGIIKSLCSYNSKVVVLLSSLVFHVGFD